MYQLAIISKSSTICFSCCRGFLIAYTCCSTSVFWGKGKSGFLSHRFEKGGSAAALLVAVADVLWPDRKQTHLRPSPEKGTSATVATPRLRVTGEKGSPLVLPASSPRKRMRKFSCQNVKGKNSILLQNRTLERKEETDYQKKKKIITTEIEMKW
ncbi:hypothetical protein MRB53_006078 [Persea americana]|uniref:Uncharacterized protein n=1 Tax=Persea americana TaxID=3435 RepID=A0ACC2MFW3_PERAE|nr:hypothetical protein MRB53_006078 [Persea americana]